MAHVLVNLEDYQYLFEKIRWIQLLLAAGAALTVLNVCRHRAPRRVEAVP